MEIILGILFIAVVIGVFFAKGQTQKYPPR